MSDTKFVIAINTNKYLPYSETFIKNHIEGVNKFDCIVFASEKIKSGLKPECKSEYIIKDTFIGKVQDVIYKLGFNLPGLLKYLVYNKVSLIHSHFGQNGYASIAVAKKLNIPHVTTFHGLDLSLIHI